MEEEKGCKLFTYAHNQLFNMTNVHTRTHSATLQTLLHFCSPLSFAATGVCLGCIWGKFHVVIFHHACVVLPISDIQASTACSEQVQTSLHFAVLLSLCDRVQTVIFQ